MYIYVTNKPQFFFFVVIAYYHHPHTAKAVRKCAREREAEEDRDRERETFCIPPYLLEGLLLLLLLLLSVA